MSGTARARLLYVVFVLFSAACRDIGGEDVCAKKLSPRLLNEISTPGFKDKEYRVIVRFSDSTGIREVIPSITIDSKSIATGFLSAAEIRKLCSLNQVQFIDLPKRYHTLEQN
jgi:hypothetical protein